MLAIVGLVIEMGAEVDAAMGNGCSALDVARRKGHRDLLKLFEGAGTNPTARTWKMEVVDRGRMYIPGRGMGRGSPPTRLFTVLGPGV